MKRRGNQRLVTLIVLVAAAVLLLFIGSRSNALRPVVSLLMAPLSPVSRLLSGGAESLSALGDEAQPDYQALLERNRELERTLAALQVEIVRYREIEEDYYRLSELVDYLATRPDQDIVTANVIARDTSSYLRWIIINRGARDGIQVGNPVINELGLVGRVEEIAANSAWVRLVNDPASAVNAYLQKARAEGTVLGQLQGGLRMELIPQEAVVENGDLVLTSGLGGTFPANIVIGQVTSVRRQQAELFQTAEIRPIVDFDRLEIVAVITSFTPIDTSIFNDVIEEESQQIP